jgi:hypothetical protein
VGLGRWIVDTATAVNVVGEGVDRIDGLARRAAAGVQSSRRGLVGLHGVGVAERSQAQVVAAGDWYHDDADRAIAIAVIDAAIATLRRDAEAQATAPESPATRAQWWRAEVAPILADWEAFREHETSWAARTATDWATYEAWLAVVRQLRSSARTLGIALASSEPGHLPTTVFERGAQGRGGQAEVAWTIGRVLLYTALGVAGVAGIYTAWRDLREPREEPR